jgi:uncharacterized membrane protein
MPGFMTADYIGLALIAAAWLGYYGLVERSRFAGRTLNALMNRYRWDWMQQMEQRDLRIIDTQIMGSLQNGTAFFASTSLIAIGAAATLLRATDNVLQMFGDLPLAPVPSRGLWDTKVIGLAVIFIYAFYKFSWSYRLFNYAAIMLGATPMPANEDRTKRHRMAHRAAEMNIVAARHFNRGQPAFFFALGYLGWFISPYVLIGATFAVLVVMSARQFCSDARAAITNSIDRPMRTALARSAVPFRRPARIDGSSVGAAKCRNGLHFRFG